MQSSMASMSAGSGANSLSDSCRFQVSLARLLCSDVLFMLTSYCLCWQDSADDGPTLTFPEPNDYILAELCEQTFGPDDKEGMFESPDYPDEYYAKEDCLFFFEAEEDEIIQITFVEQFNIEEDDNCQFDQVEVHDGRYGFSPLIAKLCGTVPPDPVTSTSNFLWVGFFTDADIEESGFRAHFRYLKNPNYPPVTSPMSLQDEQDQKVVLGPEDCFFKLENQFDGEIDSSMLRRALMDRDMYPADKVDCTWEINVPENYKILMEFHEFSLAYVNECDYNRLILYDRYALDNRQLSEFCSTSAPSVMTKTNRGYVRFVSTKNIDRNEWRLIYTAYRDKPCNTTLSFECGQHICIDHALRCNGRPNCWNYASDEEGCEATPPLLKGKIDATLGVIMTLILLTTLLTIILSCRHSWLRTKHKAREARQRRTVERSAVQYLMDTGEVQGDASDLKTANPQHFQRYKYSEVRSGSSSGQYPKHLDQCASTSRCGKSSDGCGSASASQVNDYLEQLMDRRNSAAGSPGLFTWEPDSERPPSASNKHGKSAWNMFV